MARKKLSILILLTFSAISLKAITVSGTIPGFASSYITLYKYTDCIVFNTEQIGEAYADSTGHFIIYAGLNGAKKLKIVCGDRSVSFYCQQNTMYTVIEKGVNLIIEEDKRGLNTILNEVQQQIILWYNLFMNDTGLFINTIAPSLVLKKLDSLKENYLTENDVEINNDLEYQFGGYALLFICNSYFRYDSIMAQKAFASLENKLILSQPIAFNNPFYINFASNYLSYRRRFMVKYDRYEDDIIAYASFKRDSLTELNKVLFTKIFYNNKSYKREETLEQFNATVQHTTSDYKIPLFREYIGLMIVANNKLTKGSPFPVLTLTDEKGHSSSIGDIHTPYILVDFWATWCGPCKRSMANFPALIARYKDKLTIVSISVDEGAETMIAFLEKNNYMGKWVTLYNGKQGGYLDQLKIDGYPSCYILDAEKNLIEMPEWEMITRELNELVR